MAVVKNILRQPLVIDTKDGAIHFLAKEVKEIAEETLNEQEFKNHFDSGNLLLVKLG